MSSDLPIGDLPLPHNLDAERAVLGAILLDHRRLSEALEVVRVEDFYRVAHRRMFARMVALGEVQQAIDTLTLRDELGKHNELDEVGGVAYLSSLTDGVPRGTNIAEYARIVREKADLRRLIDGANTMLRAAYDTSEDVSVILEHAEKTVLGLADRATATGFESMRTIAMRGMDALEGAIQKKQRVVGVPSGFTDLDELTRGFQAGKLITIGARPGMGKSSLALNIAQHAASHGYAAAVASLEMEKDELFIRQVAASARVDSHRLSSGYLGEREWSRISAAIGTIAESPLFIDEQPAVSLFEIRSRARKLKVEHDLRLLVIDYLQLMSAHEKASNRTLELGAITSGLKALAKELKIPILLLSQLSRDLEKRGGRPKLSDLRDSGSIEQDSDIVMFIHRNDPPAEGQEGIAELIVAKHRGGPLGTVKLAWFDSETRFDNFEPSSADYQDQRLPVGDR